MQNIFQGDVRINRVVAEALNYTIDPNDRELRVGRFTQDMYLSTFFYLSKRFGVPMIWDEYKDAGIWRFKVKQYGILVRMDSSAVSFQMYGRIGNVELHSPCIIKRNRVRMATNDGYIRLFETELNEKEEQVLDEQFTKFAEENEFDPNAITQEEYDAKYRALWWKYLIKYNDSLGGFDYHEFRAKYGDEYQNAYTRHALRTLRQFLKNMLTPIWVRDVPYNIKGEVDGDYSRYENNIEIIFDNQ